MRARVRLWWIIRRIRWRVWIRGGRATSQRRSIKAGHKRGIGEMIDASCESDDLAPGWL